MTVSRQLGERMPRRVLLVGWDAADWQMIRPLLAQGLMPTLAAFLARGSSGDLATTRPILSPILWNSIATGRRPDAHGVLGFTEPVPDGPGIRPVASTSRRCKALWNILTQCGLRSNVVGWYASHPAEPIRGAMVSNQVEFRSAQEGPGAPLPAGSVHPAEIAAEMAECRVHPAEIDATAVLPFVPDAVRELERAGNRVGKLQQLLAQTASVHAMALRLMERDDWDFTAVYYEGIDRFGHEFMEFHPPRMEQVEERDFEAYRHCMVGIYRFHDMLLDALLRQAGPDTAVIVMSDHGYWNDHRRPDPRPGKTGPVDWHRPYGMLAAAGPGIRAGGTLHGASIMDLTPTALTLLGLPAAADMPGRVLVEALDGIAELPRVPSWESVLGECGMHPADVRVDPEEARAALQQLVDLGYIDPPSEDDERSRRDTVDSNRMQLVQSMLHWRDFAGALDVLAQLEGEVRDSAGAALIRAQCLLGMGQAEAAMALLDAMPSDSREREALARLRAAAALATGRPAVAAEQLQALVAAGAGPDVRAMLGHAQAAAGALEDAEASFGIALAAEPEDPEVLGALASVRLRRGDAAGALDAGLRAASLRMNDPRIHLTVGRAFAALGEHAEAVTALTVCVAQAPAWEEAARELEAARRAARA
jgi:predicted AlkP superfamily phosphohydrolase/phosphomutase/Flp pilus assembly protein TadD